MFMCSGQLFSHGESASSSQIPARQRFARGQDLFGENVEIAAAERLQHVEVLRRIEEAVRVIDADRLHAPAGDERLEECVRRGEDLGILDPQPGDRTPAPGEIYAARIDRLVPKAGAAFVRIADSHQGYLREAKGLREGEKVVVQVSSFPEPGKAAPVSRNLLFKSRWLILTPGRPGVNVSRNIKSASDRERLTACIDLRDEDCGVILRTAARNATDDDLRRAFAAMAETVRALPDFTDIGSQRGMPLWSANAVLTAVREWTDPAPDQVVYAGSDRADADEASSVFREHPDLAPVTHRFDGPDPFDHYGVWAEIERL